MTQTQTSTQAPIIHRCRYCGAEFYHQKQGVRKYCSDSCRKKATRLMEDKAKKAADQKARREKHKEYVKYYAKTATYKQVHPETRTGTCPACGGHTDKLRVYHTSATDYIMLCPECWRVRNALRLQGKPQRKAMQAYYSMMANPPEPPKVTLPHSVPLTKPYQLDLPFDVPLTPAVVDEPKKDMEAIYKEIEATTDYTRRLLEEQRDILDQLAREIVAAKADIATMKRAIGVNPLP